MISWKHSYNRLKEENEIAKKKKQALDGLFGKGKISQSTYDSFNAEIVATIAEIQKQQDELIAKMQTKSAELENQIKTLEVLLANYEIQYVAGEIDQPTYSLEINLLNNALDISRHELITVQTAVTLLSNPTTSAVPVNEAPVPVVEAPPVETPKAEAAAPIEVVAPAPAEVAPTEFFPAPEPTIAAEPIPETIAPVIEQPAPDAPAEIAQPAPEPEVIAQPAVEEPAPVVEAPIVEEPVAVVEAVPAPVEEASVIEAPVVEEPVPAPVKTQMPAEPAPVVEESVAVVEETPVEETPVVEAPVSVEPALVVEESGCC